MQQYWSIKKKLTLQFPLFYSVIQADWCSLAEVLVTSSRPTGLSDMDVSFPCLFPSSVVAVLALLQFVLPLWEVRRLLLGCVCLILTLLHLIYLASAIPALSSVPVVSKFSKNCIGSSPWCHSLISSIRIVPESFKELLCLSNGRAYPLSCRG